MNLGFLNIGTQEMVLIAIVILLLFGGKKLPELARGLGRGIREFKDASDDIKEEISNQINNFEKDLDVTVDDKPASKAKSQPAATATPEGTASETVAEPSSDTASEPSSEAKKEFPKFTTPENAMQHHPGEQPAADGEHYTYGYNDHFANEEERAGVESEADNAIETDATSESEVSETEIPETKTSATETDGDASKGEQPKNA